MKYIQFTYKNRPKDLRIGYIDGNCVVDLNGQDTNMPKTMLDFLQNDYFWKRIKDLRIRTPLCTTALKNVCLKTPINGMDKVLSITLNYKDHCDQHKLDEPRIPVVVSKFPSTVTGPKDPVLIRTNITSKVDYEVELCVVIGRTASCVTAEEAHCYVFGYTIAQDICARDWQQELNDDSFTIGSGMDTFCPIGPWVVSKDEIGDVNNLRIRCSVNGICKQKSNTNQMVHKIPQIIERISSVVTLYPGDLILTGTPAGVGMYSTPPEYLKPGDVLESEIENIGVLETRIEKYIPPERIPKHKEIRWPY